MGKTKHSLENIDLLRDLPPEELETLSRRAAWRRVEEGELVVGHLDEGTDVFFIVEGSVRVIAHSLAGREIAFRDLQSGQFFGELAAIDGRPRSANIIALGDSLLASLSAADFKALLRRRPLVAEQIEVALTTLIRQLTERVFEFSSLAVRHRLHAELLRLARLNARDDEEIVIAPMPTHAELASRISTHREAITRELKVLARDGVVEQRRGALAITDLDRLETMVLEVTGLPTEHVAL